MIVHSQYLGNQELLKLQKTAFLASGNIASEEVLRVYDWATEMRSRGDVSSVDLTVNWNKTCFTS